MSGHWLSGAGATGRWSRLHDTIKFPIVGVILLVVLWESVRRWLGY